MHVPNGVWGYDTPCDEEDLKDVVNRLLEMTDTGPSSKLQHHGKLAIMLKPTSLR
jgi:hypothetical protein